MNGAHIVMGINDPNPDVAGMNETAPFVGTGVAEYMIHPTKSAFRHWVDTSAVTQSATASSIDITDCHSRCGVSPITFTECSLNVSLQHNVHHTECSLNIH
jgi:hypothetical protein